MIKNMNKIDRPIILSIIIVLLIVLLIFGFISFKNYSLSKSKNDSSNQSSPQKKNQVIYKDYAYTLPYGWEYNKNYSNGLNIYTLRYENGVETRLSFVINVHDVASIGYKGNNLFKDVEFFEEKLRNSKTYDEVGEGKSIQYGSTPVIVIPCYYDSSKVLFSYLPAYDDYFYYVKLYLEKKIDGKVETDINYDDFYTVVEFLNSREKI